MKTYFSICFVMCLSISLKAQQIQTTQQVVYFDSNKSVLDDHQKRILHQFLAANPPTDGCAWRIYGYTDSDGTMDYNAQLANQRGESVRAAILDHFPLYAVEIASYGEENPFASNETESGKQSNRRVEIYLDCRKRDHYLKLESSQKSTTDSLVLTMDQFNRKDSLLWALRDKPQTFTIDPKMDNRITGKEGCVLIFPSNAFRMPSGMEQDSVRIELTEVLDVASMVMNNMHTASNGEALISGGMIEVRAFVGDQEIKLRSDQSYMTMVPTERYDDRMMLFRGSRGHDADQHVNWRTDDNQAFQYINAMQLIGCGYISYSRQRCGFRCTVRSLFDKEYRKSVRARRTVVNRKMCQMWTNRFANQSWAMPLAYESFYESEFKRLGVSNMEEYERALDAELTKKSMDALQKGNGFYVFASTGLGMANCDYYRGGKNDYKMVRVKFEERHDYMCSYFIKGENMCLPLEQGNKGFGVKAPKGRQGTVIAMYYQNNQIFFASQIITPELETPLSWDFQVMTAEEVRAEIKRLAAIQPSSLVTQLF